MLKPLPTEKKQRTYRHFTLPPVASAPAEKLDFFYIGKKTGTVDALIKKFESGYAAENTEQAMHMLKRLSTYSNNTPDVFLADAELGYQPLLAFFKHISADKTLTNVPFFIEGAAISETELQKFRREPFADDIIALKELGVDRLISKISFWKKIKLKVSNSKQPSLVESFSLADNSPAFIAKRAFDIVASSLLMILFSPLFLLISLALRIESKGPVFYISKRAGRGYKIFNFYKFRTMEVEANNKISDVSHLNLYNPLRMNGPVFIKIDNDPRVTKLGAFLRKCSLDELPQLLNVLLGDMSIVGNRPLPLYEAATLTTDDWAKRFMAPAGMTGLWQINKKNQEKMTAEERIRLDINYADRSNFLFDLWIMARTPSAAIQGTNA